MLTCEDRHRPRVKSQSFRSKRWAVAREPERYKCNRLPVDFGKREILRLEPVKCVKIARTSSCVRVGLRGNLFGASRRKINISTLVG
ncbi:unnamed protein product [Hermetia illucens]|uniref:Uncharacterized protein n=1 Tax=Hermetia illucens TaxID=343691 RepID=A0A7R8V6E2_HERIL|nr:unnamed protein product [Hermetia illucens]